MHEKGLSLAQKAKEMDIDTLEGLKRCQLFAGLTDEEIISLAHQVRYRVLRYRKGELFTLAGAVCQHAAIILSGEMAAKLVAPTGRIIQMSLHHSGNMLAPAFLFARDNTYPVTVEAQSDCRVFRMHRDDMTALLAADARVNMNFVRILSNIISYLTKKVSVMSMNVREKVCHYLHEEMVRQHSVLLTLPLSRQAIADTFSIQKYSLQRCMSELKADGVIDFEGRAVHILKPQELEV